MQLVLTDLTLRSIQFAAILGDLSHRTDTYLARQDFSSNVSCLFANCEQARFLCDSAPALIPPGNWNEHSLGTFFEYFYYSNLTFRFSYLRELPTLACVC